MILVPESSLLPNDPQNSLAAKEVTALDSEITQILNSNMSSYEKLQSYLEILHKYLAMKENIPLPKFEISNLPQTSFSSTTPLIKKQPTPYTPISYTPQHFASFHPKYSEIEESLRKKYGNIYADSFKEGLDSAKKLQETLETDLGAVGYTPRELDLGAVGYTSEGREREGDQRDEMDLFENEKTSSSKKKKRKRKKRRQEHELLNSRTGWKDL